MSAAATLSNDAIITLIVFVATIVLLIWQKVHPVILGASIPTILAAFNIIKPGSAYMQFANTTVVFFLGLTVIGEAFFKTGLADYLGRKIIGLLGKSEKGLISGTGLVAGGLSAFLNDTGSTACLMPIVGSMAEEAKIPKSKLLMALAFFSSLGGTITLIGTTPHIIVNGMLKEQGLREFGFFEYTYIGLPLLVAGIFYMVFIGSKLLPDKDLKLKETKAVEANPKKMILAAGIFIVVIIAMATEIVAAHVAGVIGAILVVAFGILSVKEAVNSFSVMTIFLVGGIFPLSMALVSTGAAAYGVELIKPALSGLSPLVLIAAISFIMLVATQFLLNSSATVLILPVAIMLCQAADVNPLAGAMAVSVCASGAFMTPFGTGPNLLVWEAGGYTMKDYAKCGFLMTVIFWIITTAMCYILYV